ncbi:unnamed protein product [Symbiodinium sp. CCMP2592]|nr:unnamed protein product [Symbiodinium sp. CCMP2592]
MGTSGKRSGEEGRPKIRVKGKSAPVPEVKREKVKKEKKEKKEKKAAEEQPEAVVEPRSKRPKTSTSLALVPAARSDASPSEPSTPAEKIRHGMSSPSASQRAHVEALMEVKKAAAAANMSVEEYLTAQSGKQLEDRLEAAASQDEDGGEDSSDASEASAEESDEAEQSSAASDSDSDDAGSDGSAGDGSEASDEDEASDDIDGEPMDSDEEEILPKQTANSKPPTTVPKVEKEMKDKTGKTEKRTKDERTEKTGKAEKAPKVDKQNKTDKESKKKTAEAEKAPNETVEAEKAPKVEKLQPKVAKEIGKAMVLAEQTTQQGVVALCDANSKTHKNEWNQFSRQCLDKKKCTTSMAAHVERNKLDMFRRWLECGGDWEKVSLEMERRAENSTLARKERQGMKKRDILKKYPEELLLIAKLLAKKMFEEDEDFPGDEDEYYFYVNAGSKVRKENRTSEALQLKVRDTAPNQGLVDALTSEGGILGAGALAAPENMSEEGSKNLLDSLCKEGVAKAKPPKVKDEAGTEKRMQDILNESTAARKFSIALKHVEYSGDLVKDLTKHNSKLEDIYAKLQELKKRGVKKDKEYVKFYAIVDHMHEWYKKAEESVGVV